jgi:hypothetical protein
MTVNYDAGMLDVLLSCTEKHFFLMPSGGFIHLWKVRDMYPPSFSPRNGPIAVVMSVAAAGIWLAG